jgi:quinolinate synthase
VLIHPECPKPACDAADAVLSTGGMCRYVQTRSETEFIIGTEIGILHRLRKENPEKTFHPLIEQAICPDMKRITLEKVLLSLRDMSTVITVPEPTASKARRAIETMLAAH